MLLSYSMGILKLIAVTGIGIGLHKRSRLRCSIPGNRLGSSIDYVQLQIYDDLIIVHRNCGQDSVVKDVVI
jgi:hypothetical protein